MDRKITFSTVKFGQSPKPFNESTETIKSLFKRKTVEEIKKDTLKIELYDKYLSHFNPDRDIIVSKEVLDLASQLKSLIQIKDRVESISESVEFVKSRYLTPIPKPNEEKISKEEKILELKNKLLKKGKRKI